MYWKFLATTVLLLLACSAWPGSAQPPAPAPEDSTVAPSAVVSVRDVPEHGPSVGDTLAKPRRTPDDDALHATKRAFGQAHHAPAPAPSTLASPSAGSVVSGTTTLVGLQRTESGGFVPPDTQAAVGPSHIVELVNLEGRIWNKTDRSIAKTFALNSFFGFPTSTNLSDPKIRYDATSGRWFVAAISYNNSFTQGAWNLAVSTTGDPTSTFVIYRLSTSKSAPDFPALAVNDDKVVLTANAFRANSYLGTEFAVFNKADLLAGASARVSYFGPPRGSFTIQPGHPLTACVIAGCPIYMAAVAFNSASTIQLWTISGVPGVGSGVAVTTASLSIGSLTSPPDAPQPGTSTLIATNDNRLLEASYRGTASGGTLWVAANSACVPAADTATRACLRFINLSISSSGSVTKLQDFDFGQSGFYYYFPAIATDGSGNLIAGFSGSSSDTFAGVYASGQKTTDGANTFQSPVLLHGGENSYTPFADRWGDYSAAALDPVSPSTVWVAGEYVAISGGSDWGTFLAPIQMP
jgi:hypothetical protein